MYLWVTNSTRKPFLILKESFKKLKLLKIVLLKNGSTYFY